MPQICRAFFRCTNEEESNLLVDLILSEQRHAPSSVPFFGSWGRLNSHSLYPFVLQDGRLDFGDEIDANQDHRSRFAQFDLVNRIIAVGDEYILSYYGKKFVMKLEKLTALDSLVTS